MREPSDVLATLTLGSRARCVTAAVAMCVVMCACKVYDPNALEPSRQLERDGAVADDAATSADAAPDGQVSFDSGADASEPEPECIQNPDPEAFACSEICPEQCNGADDDCDGQTDEQASCAAPHTEARCNAGACLIVACRDGHRDCDGLAANGCEIAPTDPAHCGACDRGCSLQRATATCEDSTCVVAQCAAGFGDCDGNRNSCERSTRTVTNCGACGVPCGPLAHATPACDTGSCNVAACIGHFGNCDGNPVNGCEDPLVSLTHCGGCGVTCPKASCAGGVCTAVQCTGNLADCDADEVDCEIDLSNNPQHCGSCAQACAFSTATPNGGLACTLGECDVSCDPGRGNCDGVYENGCEVDVRVSAAHCGSCGTACDALPHVATGACASSSCSVTTCDAGWADCDRNAANGCERDTTALGPCEPDANCTRRVLGMHEYFFCTNARTQADARARCTLQSGGNVVHVDDATENAFLAMYRQQDSWLGATDAREGTFRWQDDGVPFWKGTASGAAVLSRYANFTGGQPDDAGANEDCIRIAADGTWNDAACSATRGFICEVAPDECPSDATKRAPGQCGCGVADTDSDADGFADCVESCDGDVQKQAPGLCGCGVVDSSTDTDSDGALDCNDGCDADPTVMTACLGFPPANFNPEVVNWSAQPTTTLNCGTTTIDSTPLGGSAVATITNWCGTAPTPIVQAQSGGPDLVIIPVRSLNLASGNTLRLVGTRPIVLAVAGNVTIAGIVDANATATTPGAGGNWNCGSSTGGDANAGTCTGGSEGGGGGGFATSGGPGGQGGAGTLGAGGAARGAATNLAPLMGGCGGGHGGGNAVDADGGAGGGAVQIVASGTLTVTGTIRASGGTGAVGSCGNEAGGGGGGSGGAILLEASVLQTGSAMLVVRGGNGAASGSNDAGGAGAATAAANGAQGASGGANGGGGGGGGYGRVRSIDH